MLYTDLRLGYSSDILVCRFDLKMEQYFTDNAKERVIIEILQIFHFDFPHSIEKKKIVMLDVWKYYSYINSALSLAYLPIQP